MNEFNDTFGKIKSQPTKVLLACDTSKRRAIEMITQFKETPCGTMPFTHFQVDFKGTDINGVVTTTTLEEAISAYLQ